jgi:hypothetical protein
VPDTTDAYEDLRGAKPGMPEGVPALGLAPEYEFVIVGRVSREDSRILGG